MNALFASTFKIAFSFYSLSFSNYIIFSFASNSITLLSKLLFSLLNFYNHQHHTSTLTSNSLSISSNYSLFTFSGIPPSTGTYTFLYIFAVDFNFSANPPFFLTLPGAVDGLCNPLFSGDPAPFSSSSWSQGSAACCSLMASFLKDLASS